MESSPFLDAYFWNNSVRQWFVALAAGAGTYVAVWLALRLVRNSLASFAARTAAIWDDVVTHALSNTRALFMVTVGVYVGSLFVLLPDGAQRGLTTVGVLLLLFQTGIWATSGLRFWLEHYTRQLEDDRGTATTVTAMGFLARMLVWSILLLVALDNIGVDVTALVTGLGIGGVAVALAVQNILKDLFASLSIVLDKPFVLGDFVVVDDLRGHVEHIGLETTRIRSLWGEQLIFSNSDLLGSRLRNFGRMAERRVMFEIGVTYQTPRDRLEQIPGMIREAIESQPLVRFDRSHFKRYGDFALTFESVYYVLSPDYNAYMDIQQAVNLRIHERFEQDGISFAYPTQTVILAKATA
jgi:small-conductance mechanosensitive channel